jgi:DNA-binding beta-propeller fold protein YncE
VESTPIQRPDGRRSPDLDFRKPVLTRLFPAILIAISSSLAATEPESAQTVRFRRPVAAAAFDGGRRLAVANRDSGSISLVDTENWAVITEQDVGRSLSDVAFDPLHDRLIALDQTAHELLLLRPNIARLQTTLRQAVARSPVSLGVAPDGRWLSVASLWSRSVTLLEWTDPDALSVRHVIELPFAPRRQRPLPGGQLIVAGAFRAELAVIDVAAGKLRFVRELPGHNVGGLAQSPRGDRLYVTCQLLDPSAPTTFDGIHWGGLIENLVRVIPVATILDRSTDLAAQSRTIQLGSTGAGAADPAGIAFTDADRLIVVTSGIDRAAVFPELQSIVSPEVPTGRRPTAVVILPGRDQAVVVNTLGDSLTVIDTARGRKMRDVLLGPSPPAGPRERGESLFFDARLSHDNWLTCHSCHTDGHANGLLADTFSDRSFGTPKRVLSLLGTRDNNPWAWSGSLRTLHEQVVQSVASSMQGGKLPLAQADDLVAYLHSLPHAPPVLPVLRSAEDALLLERGRAVFKEQGCAACHIPPLTYTSDQIVDVGLEDEQGLRKFNPPSLRGVSQRDSFLHDGRAKSLHAVFQDVGHQLREVLPDEDLVALVRFLQGL